MSVKSKMIDEERIMDGWDIFSVDPCTWSMVSCTSDGFVKSLYCLSFFSLFLSILLLSNPVLIQGGCTGTV